MVKNYKLHIYNLDEPSEIQNYKKLLSKKWNNNIYNSVEHLDYFKSNTGEVKFFIFKKNGDILALMPLILRNINFDSKEDLYDVTSPYGYSGPMFCEYATTEDISSFWEYVDRWYANNNVVTEFIRFSLTDNQREYSGNLLNTLLNVKGKLFENFNDQWNSFLPKVRNNYRKAENNNLSFKIYSNAEITKEVISTFKDIYINTMKRNNAQSIYFFSKDYFETLILSNPDNFSIAIVYFEDHPISAELIINLDKTIFAYLGGTDANYFNYRPNDFLRVNIIKWAISENFEYYVLGGGMKDGDGLYKSKKAFFPKNEDVYFYTGRKIINPELYEQLCCLHDSNFKNLSDNDLNQKFFPYYRTTE